MSTNMTLIETKTAGSGGVSNFDFTSIPATYTDLYILCSLRSSISANADDIKIEFNNSSSNFSWKNLYGNGSTVISQNNTNNQIGTIPAASMTASSFGNASIYITNYASANYKSVSGDSVAENNATRGDQAFYATLWSNTAAITSVKLLPSSGTFLEFSSASLYGISNVTSTTKATGGIVSSDGTYNYHMFPYSGTFTPTTAISADVLCIAGGGAGGPAGGGGAGGVLYSASQSLSTAQTITIGAGGAGVAGGYPSSAGNNGGNSSCGSLTATGGGGGGGYNTNATSGAGANGGSGGGAGTDNGGSGGTANAGLGTSGQGNNGGVSSYASTAPYSGAGGGGAGGVGGTTLAADKAGLGGVGTVTYVSWANATQTGVNGYYAGGGGGGSYGVYSGSTPGTGGLGGGGTGSATGAGTNGLTNTGGGGGGGNASTSASGGSGLVIIRYAI